MRNLLSKSKQSLLAFSLLGLISSPSYAISPDAQAIVNAINSAAAVITTILTNQFSYIKDKIDKNLEAEQPFYDETQARNNLVPIANASVGTMTEENSLQTVTDIIGPDANLKAKINEIANIPGGDSFNPLTAQTVFLPEAAKVAMNQLLRCNNNNFSFDALIGPSKYENKPISGCGDKPIDQKMYAENYIKNAGYLAMPINDFTVEQALKNRVIDNADQAQRLASSQPYKDFIVARRFMVSMRSAALSNLYYLYNQRVQVPDPRTGIPTSAMDLAEQGANTRIGNSDWYDQMLNAYPAKLAREQVFILAEMRHELHQMHKENQRLLAVMSLQVISNLSAGNALLNMKMAPVQAKINELKEAEKQSEEQKELEEKAKKYDEEGEGSLEEKAKKFQEESPSLEEISKKLNQ